MVGSDVVGVRQVYDDYVEIGGSLTIDGKMWRLVSLHKIGGIPEVLPRGLARGRSLP